MPASPTPLRATISAALIAVLCSGCGTLPSGKGWGEEATIRPGWARVGEAARESATDPWVWVPLAGAAVFQIDNLDRRTSDWAREHTPVFGSQQNAERWSDDLRSTAVLLDYATVLATPSGDDAEEWLINKAKGTLVEVAAIGSTASTTSFIKRTAGRERPNGADTKSMPSGHTSSAAVHTRDAMLNLDAIDMDPAWRTVGDIGLHAISIGTGWARVEAGWHYPSDTLVGMAIGNFFASFFNRAFLRTEDGDEPSLSLSATDGGAMLQWHVSF